MKQLKMKQKGKKGGFLGMLLGNLGTGFLGNLLAGKGTGKATIRAGEGTVSAGQDF